MRVGADSLAADAWGTQRNRIAILDTGLTIDFIVSAPSYPLLPVAREPPNVSLLRYARSG